MAEVPESAELGEVWRHLQELQPGTRFSQDDVGNCAKKQTIHNSLSIAEVHAWNMQQPNQNDFDM